jgi:acylphosphatase
MKHINLKITGKVQGVWYRKSTFDEARRLGLKGFVRNQPDGSVYAEAEGEAEILDQFIAWCKVGPRLARVMEVKVEEGPIEHFDSFEVKY